MPERAKRRYFLFHGHAYQPPRECPWTQRIERQPGAAPYHDWNERINAECYAANARARVLDSGGNVVQLVNNYAHVSFNAAATLLFWLQEHAPDTLEAMIEGDKLSRERFGGHGNAIAQVYNHPIMPLAHDRDQKTQVIWGKEVFRSFFGRDPEGMWLAEAAVNIPTLEALAAEGIKFTILAPRQARRWRRIGEQSWHESSIDPTRAYLLKLPSGKSITLFFYDGPVSQAVAFEKLLSNGESFLNRMKSGFNDGRAHDELMHVAVDWETVGHHHRHGEMCLAWVFNRLQHDKNLQVTNYGQYLELHPAEYEVEIRENSSWSCDHGVERWRSNCGCRTRDGWHQHWRAPLRNGLNALRERIDTLFDQRGRKLFRDPWAARDEYIQVILDSAKLSGFLKTHAVGELSEDRVREAVSLMEMEHYAMLMLTSCAWFFDDISGIEPVQNLRYAARAMELAGLFSSEDLEALLLKHLEGAAGNAPELGNGRVVWERLVRPDALAKQLNQACYDLSTPLAVERARKLVERTLSVIPKFDLSPVQDRVLNAYCRLKAAGKMTDELRQSFVGLVVKLRMAESLLGWCQAGYGHNVTRRRLRRRQPRSVENQSSKRNRNRQRWRS